MSRALAVAVATGCLALTACARPAPPSKNVTAAIAGFDAYKAGDETALQQQIQALGVGLPEDRSAGPFVACTADGYALRRQARALQALSFLDDPGLRGASETVRYLFLQQMIMGGGGNVKSPENVGGPLDFECEHDPDWSASHDLDVREQFEIRDAGRDHLRAWFTALKQSYGAQFDTQMQATAKQLHDMGLSQNDEWSPPQALGE
jgi:hypothetical protein